MSQEQVNKRKWFFCFILFSRCFSDFITEYYILCFNKGFYCMHFKHVVLLRFSEKKILKWHYSINRKDLFQIIKSISLFKTHIWSIYYWSISLSWRLKQVSRTYNGSNQCNCYRCPSYSKTPTIRERTS